MVVSTYPVATQVLGDMRRRSQQAAGESTRGSGCRRSSFITDFGFHPFWAHRGIDLNLAVHPATVEAVKRKTGRPSMACSPLVGPTFSLARAARPLNGPGSACAPTTWPS